MGEFHSFPCTDPDTGSKVQGMNSIGCVGAQGGTHKSGGLYSRSFTRASVEDGENLLRYITLKDLPAHHLSSLWTAMMSAA